MVRVNVELASLTANPPKSGAVVAVFVRPTEPPDKVTPPNELTPEPAVVMFVEPDKAFVPEETVSVAELSFEIVPPERFNVLAEIAVSESVSSSVAPFTLSVVAEKLPLANARDAPLETVAVPDVIACPASLFVTVKDPAVTSNVGIDTVPDVLVIVDVPAEVVAVPVSVPPPVFVTAPLVKASDVTVALPAPVLASVPAATVV